MIKNKQIDISYTTINTLNNDNFFYKINYIISIYRKVLISLCFILIYLNMYSQNSFLSFQKTYPRVSEAFHEKENYLKQEFLNKGLSFPPKEILLISYKAEGELQIWVKENYQYKMFKVYNVCKKSGDFGPKRKQGDRQVPEGLYKINVFNPNSDYYLSLGIDYPNASDKILSSYNDLGGDIYIHGDCVTVGCLPMTDDLIKEIYVLNTLAKSTENRDINIYLFPFKFNKLTEYIFYKEYPEHVAFWNNLKEAYYFFKKNHRIRDFTIDSEGKYVFY